MKKTIRFIYIFLLTVILLSVNSYYTCAQKLNPGPQDLSFFSTIDETDQPYAIYIPRNFDESNGLFHFGFYLIVSCNQ